MMNTSHATIADKALRKQNSLPYCDLGGCDFPAQFFVTNDDDECVWRLCVPCAASLADDHPHIEPDELASIKAALETWATTGDWLWDMPQRRFSQFIKGTPHEAWNWKVWEVRHDIQLRIMHADVPPQNRTLPIDDEPGPPVFETVGHERSQHDPGHLDTFPVRTFTHAHGEIRMAS